MLWLAAALLVLVTMTGARYISQSSSDAAANRAHLARTAENAADSLRLAVQREVQDRLIWEIGRTPAQAARVHGDSRSTQQAAGTLQEIAASAGSASPWPAVLRQTRAVRAWESSSAARFSGRTPPPPVVDPNARAVEKNVTSVSNVLDAQMMKQAAEAARTERLTNALGLSTTLLGLLVLLAGGILVLRKAWRLAGATDARRDREGRWSQQVESILEWSNRAKEATTRGQLIGFAHQAPREAIGAVCLRVAEGYAPRHESHGLARITLPVDNAGQGLHISVCFAEGRGDDLDHHTLDLMLGHLGALWRTVLRQEELELAAGHDALTGLPNRRTFDAELRRRVGLSKRRGLGFALAIVDLDHFKLVNDSLGHPEGDAVLRRAGEAIRSVLRTSDRIYRLGGEEFALLLETSERGGVDEVLNRAREAVKGLGVEPAPGRRTSASIGWASFPEDATERGDLVAAADSALYRAKNGGRDRVIWAGAPARAA